MANDSFDPRHWGVAPVSAPVSRTSPVAGGNDFWQAAAAGVTATAPKSADIPLRGATITAERTGLALSLAILAGGALLARSLAPHAGPEVPLAAPIAAPAAEAGPDLTERALNFSDIAQLTEALAAAGVPAAEVRTATAAAARSLIKSGEVRALIVLAPGPSGPVLHTLRASYLDGSGVILRRAEDGSFATSVTQPDVTRQIKVMRGELDSDSFYSSAVAAGLIDTLIPEFINAFSYDFNLASEVSPGDTFEVAYAQDVNADGQAVGTPHLLYASLTTRAKSVALFRYQLPDGTVGWFDGNGASTKRGLMRTPIDGARITSKFGLRFHPVLHYTRLHGGVDFGAPVGTPIYAAADGTVLTSGPSGGCAGTRVVIQHKDGMQTYYFHLSRIAEGTSIGSPVLQGTTIGYSGATGGCITGPHLHYEVHINGEKIDPLSVKTDDGERKALNGAALAGFMRERDRIDLERARQAY